MTGLNQQLSPILDPVPTAMLVIFRIGGLMIFGPLLSSVIIPMRVKLFLALVVGLAVLILARSGDTADALARVRDIFEFDPETGADLLLQLEDSLIDQSAASGLADTPGAWRARPRRPARACTPHQQFRTSSASARAGASSAAVEP